MRCVRKITQRLGFSNLEKSVLQQSVKYPGENWEIYFTHMPKANGFSCLQVCKYTFTRWIEDFPCSSEQAKGGSENFNP